MESLVATWYDWLVFVGVFATAAIAIYLYFETQDASDPSGAKIVRVISIVGIVMTLPSLWQKIDVLNGLPDEFFGVDIDDLLFSELFADTFQALYPNLVFFGYLGLLGVIVSIIGLIYYFTSVKGSDTYAPTMPSSQPAVPPPPAVMPPAPAPAPAPAAAPTPQQQAPAHLTQPMHPNLPASAWLVMRAGPRMGTQYGLDERGANIIGRDPSRADIVIDEDTVSREHARIRHDNGQYVVYDLASTSGTFVNNNKVQKQLLYDDDVVQVGRVELVFKKVS